MRLQKQSISYLYLRDEEPLPRGALRLFPIKDRCGTTNISPIETISELFRYCTHNRDVFVNLFSDWQKSKHVYDVLFLDIDNNDLSRSLCVLLDVVNKLNDNNVKNYNIYFSGSKGFHVYVRFEPTFLKNYRTAVMNFTKKIGILYAIDTGVIEVNRVTRVPYSINRKSGLCCIPIKSTDVEIDTILEMADVENSIACVDKPLKVNYGLGQRLKAVDGESMSVNGNEFIIAGHDSIMFSSPDYYPDCMNDMVEKAVNGDPLNHIERLELGKFLLYCFGGDLDEVSRYYQHQHNYDELKTKYHLDYIMKRDLKISNCDGLLSHGLCPFNEGEQEQCPFYPSLNSLIQREISNG